MTSTLKSAFEEARSRKHETSTKNISRLAHADDSEMKEVPSSSDLSSTTASSSGTHEVSPTLPDSLSADAQYLLTNFSPLPKCVVFDLDDTLWSGDVDMSRGPPWIPCPVSAKPPAVDGISSKGGGSRGFKPRRRGSSAEADLPLFREVVRVISVLEELMTDHGSDIKICIASCTWAPAWANEALRVFRTHRGTPFSKLIASSQCFDGCKQQHINLICRDLKITPLDLVFYDNLNYNIRDVETIKVESSATRSDTRARQRPIAVYTPYGLDWEKFVEGLRRFDQERSVSATPLPDHISCCDA